MKNILIITLVLLTSCSSNKKTLDNLFREVKKDSSIKYKIDLINKNEEIVFLKTKEFDYDSLGGIFFKEPSYFIEKKDNKVMAVWEVIIDKKISFMSFTIGTYSAMEVYFIKQKGKWHIKESLLRKKVRLRNSKSVRLCLKIDSLNNLGKPMKYDVPREGNGSDW